MQADDGTRIDGYQQQRPYRACSGVRASQVAVPTELLRTTTVQMNFGKSGRRLPAGPKISRIRSLEPNYDTHRDASIVLAVV